jgi:molecular chaperone GrpE (heat shock protein)
MCAIESLKREKKKNKSLQEELKNKEESHHSNSKEVEQMITKLKIQVEEETKIEEALKGKLDEKNGIIEGLEAEIDTLRKYIHKKDMEKNSTRILDNIINSQIPYYDRFGIWIQSDKNKERFKLQINKERSRIKKLCRIRQRSH